MGLHQLIQFIDSDTFRMLAHEIENKLNDTILLGEFATVYHGCCFLPPSLSFTWGWVIPDREWLAVTDSYCQSDGLWQTEKVSFPIL